MAKIRNKLIACLSIACGTISSASLSLAQIPSAWSEKYELSIVPGSAANMPNGKILLWSAFGRTVFAKPPTDPGRTYTAIFDPVTGNAVEKLVTVTGHDMFCPGTTLLPDGRILVNGGSSAAKTSIFSPGGQIWSTSNQMTNPRAYQGNTLLSTGEVFTLGGSWNGGKGGNGAEVWRSGTGWRTLSGVPDTPFIGPDPKGVYRGDNHLWLIGQAGGWVFHAGPSSQMHWVDTRGAGAVVNAGPRGTDPYSMNGNVVLYDAVAGRILKTGGAPKYDGGVATKNSYVITINGGPTKPVKVKTVANLLFGRALHNSVILPTGQVVIIGGTKISRIFTDAKAVLQTEIFDPVTEKFTQLKSSPTPRTYHSVALLLQDGRVFVGGGGLCVDGFASCVNHADAEIFTPPYLLNTNGTLAVRPVITSAPVSASPGSTINVKTNTVITSFALMRASAVTHSVNNDQRRIPLVPLSGNPTAGYLLKIPANTGITLPGPYMLFAMTAQGRPSVAKSISIR